MLVTQIIDEIRYETGTNSVKVPDSYILSGINIHNNEFVMSILRSRTDYNFTINEVTTNLKSTVGLEIGDVGYNGEYPWMSDLIRLVRMEVSFDGTNFYPVEVYDISDKISRSEHVASDINSTFSQTNPFVRLERESFFVRPLKTTPSDITDGIHIWYEQRQPTLYVDNQPPIEASFHRLYILAGAIRIMKRFRREYSFNERQALMAELLRLQNEMEEYYKKQVDENIRLTTKYINYN